jgi:hypothetical protein
MSALFSAIKGIGQSAKEKSASLPDSSTKHVSDDAKQALLASTEIRPPQVSVIDQGKRKTPTVQEKDPQKGDDSLSGSFTNHNSDDPKHALLASIKSRKDGFTPRPTPSDGTPSRVEHTNNENDDPKQALLASIKSRRDSLSPKPTCSDGVPDRVKHINSTMGQKESRILLVNRMLSEAPASVKQGEPTDVYHYILYILFFDQYRFKSEKHCLLSYPVVHMQTFCKESHTRKQMIRC